MADSAVISIVARFVKVDLSMVFFVAEFWGKDRLLMICAAQER
jgi:hypothetical protein